MNRLIFAIRVLIAGGLLAVLVSIGLSMGLYLELDSANRHAQTLLTDQATLETNLATLETKNEEAEGELLELRTSIEATTGELDSLELELRITSESATRELESLRSDFQSSSQDLTEARTQRDSLRSDTNRLVQELDTAAGQNQTLTRGLRNANETLATARVQVDSMQSALESFKTAHENYYTAQLAYDQDHSGDCEYNPGLNIRECAPWAGGKAEEKENLERLWEVYSV